MIQYGLVELKYREIIDEFSGYFRTVIDNIGKKWSYYGIK